MTARERSAVLLLIVFGLVVVLAWARDAVVSIRVRPQVIFADGAFWLTCMVPPDSRNRVLDYGVVDFREHSQRQLDGLSSRITWQFLVEHVPCGVGPVYCQVGRSDGSWERAITEIVITGCN